MSSPSGLTAVQITGAPRRRVRTIALRVVSHKVRWPFTPPVASVRPSGKKASASASGPLRAGRVPTDLRVRRSIRAMVPSAWFVAMRVLFGLTVKHGTDGQLIFEAFHWKVRPRRCAPERSHAVTLPPWDPATTAVPPRTIARFSPEICPPKVCSIEPLSTFHTRKAPSNEAPMTRLPSGMNWRPMSQARTGSGWSNRCLPVRKFSTVGADVGSAGFALF